MHNQIPTIHSSCPPTPATHTPVPNPMPIDIRNEFEDLSYADKIDEAVAKFVAELGLCGEDGEGREGEEGCRYWVF